MTPTMPERQRDHEQPHLRSPELQILDTLLRIEELLTKLIEVTASVPQVTVVEPEPEPKPAPKPAARRNPRQL